MSDSPFSLSLSSSSVIPPGRNTFSSTSQSRKAYCHLTNHRRQTHILSNQRRPAQSEKGCILFIQERKTSLSTDQSQRDHVTSTPLASLRWCTPGLTPPPPHRPLPVSSCRWDPTRPRHSGAGWEQFGRRRPTGGQVAPPRPASCFRSRYPNTQLIEAGKEADNLRSWKPVSFFIFPFRMLMSHNVILTLSLKVLLSTELLFNH